MLPKNVIVNHLAMSKTIENKRVVATSAKKTNYDLDYYTKAALAGGICCAITHGALW